MTEIKIKVPSNQYLINNQQSKNKHLQYTSNW